MLSQSTDWTYSANPKRHNYYYYCFTWPFSRDDQIHRASIYSYFRREKQIVYRCVCVITIRRIAESYKINKFGKKLCIVV